jgi:hypothetical protein
MLEFPPIENFHQEGHEEHDERLLAAKTCPELNRRNAKAQIAQEEKLLRVLVVEYSALTRAVNSGLDFVSSRQ